MKPEERTKCWHSVIRRAAIPGLTAIGLVCVMGAGAALRNGSEMPGLGIVTMSVVLARYEKWKDMQAMLAQRREIRSKELEKLAGDAEKLKEELAGLESDSTAFLRKQGDLIQKEALLDATTQQYDIELAQSEASQYEAVMKEIGSVVAELAIESGRTVVLQRALEVPEGIWESVLYADPRTDMTEPLIDRLNGRYAREKK